MRHISPNKDWLDLDQSEKVALMVDWFHETFEEPYAVTLSLLASDRPLPPEARYQPFEELHEEFGGVFDYDIIELAVEEIESEGVGEWVLREGSATYPDQVVDGDADWPPIIADASPSHSEILVRADLQTRLEVLERALSAVEHDYDFRRLGHNNPPEPLDEAPITREEFDELRSVVADLKSQTQIPSPSVEVISRDKNVIERTSRAIGKWLYDKFNESSKVIAGALGLSFVQNIQGLYDGLMSVIVAVGKWLSFIL